MDNIMVYLTNGFISAFYYVQSYFWYIVLFIMLISAGCIEIHERRHLHVDDERKLI